MKTVDKLASVRRLAKQPGVLPSGFENKIDQEKYYMIWCSVVMFVETPNLGNLLRSLSLPTEFTSASVSQ